MQTLDEVSLFSDIVRTLEIGGSSDGLPGSVHVPIGGVHWAVINGNRTPGGRFDGETVKRWGVTPNHPFNLPRGWLQQIARPWSFENILHRQGRPLELSVISRRSEAGRWTSGALDFPDGVIQHVLAEDGYDCIDHEVIERSVPYMHEIFRLTE